jgi:hypothetical protein
MMPEHWEQRKKFYDVGFRFQSMLNSRFCEGSPPVLQVSVLQNFVFSFITDAQDK